MSPKELRKLREYEKTGDAIVLGEPDPYEEGLVVKIVKHNGKLKLVAGLYGCGYLEEYYVADLY